jgi:hypothetical protein
MPRQEGNQMHTILAQRSDKSGKRPVGPKAQAAVEAAPTGDGT